MGYHFVLTCQNYNDVDIQRFKVFYAAYGKYAVVGREIAPTTLTPHLQCYMSLHKRMSWAVFRANFPGWHVEQAKGTAKQNTVYCSKDGHFEVMQQIWID